MEKTDIEAGLRSLRQCLNEMKSLLAWSDLVESERKPGKPPAFEIGRDIEQDLKAQYGMFVKTLLDLEDLLANEKARFSGRQRERWKQRLSRLETECRKLKVAERFITA